MAARALLSSRFAGALHGAKVVNYCGRRTYSGAAAAAAVAPKEPVAVMASKGRLPGAAADKTAVNRPKVEESFWMRDPKTGCWMPETHMNDVDAADLRAQLLFAKKD